MNAARKTVVVTGASMGIGRAITQAFVEAGFNVMLCARSAEPLEQTARELTGITAAGQNILWEICDVSDEAQVGALADEVERALGGCDVLINNAGVLGPVGPLESVDWAEWKRAIEIDLFGVVLPCRAFIPQMKRKGRGKVINLSGGGATGSRPNFSAYAAAKTAVVRLTEVLADELRPFHIDVNAIAPGAVRTRLTTEVVDAGKTAAGAAAHDEAVQTDKKGGASPGLAAELCVFLAGPKCDGITGRLISARWDDWRTLPTRLADLAKSDLYTLRRIVPREENRA